MEFIIFIALVILVVVYFKKKKSNTVNNSELNKKSTFVSRDEVNIGEYYQTPKGNWRKKRLRESEKPEYLKYTKARKLVNDYTVIDFETTGFSHEKNKIIQVAAVKYRNHE